MSCDLLKRHPLPWSVETEDVNVPIGGWEVQRTTIGHLVANLPIGHADRYILTVDGDEHVARVREIMAMVNERD